LPDHSENLPGCGCRLFCRCGRNSRRAVVFEMGNGHQLLKTPTSISLCILGGFTWCATGQAATAEAGEHPYRCIAATNVFRLKSPPASTPEPVPTPPLPKITLQGITTIDGQREVLFKVTMPARASEAAKEVAYVLSEGQREGEIEVLEINELAGTARFRNHGVEQVLKLR